MNEKNNYNKIPAVILSGGSEIVSVSIVESLYKLDIPLIVISLGGNSILKKADPNIKYFEIKWPPSSSAEAFAELEKILIKIKAGEKMPWPVFATEDGGLRLLVEHKDKLSKYLKITGAKNLKSRGLDKNELFEFLDSQGNSNLIAPYKILPRDIESLNKLGDEIIIKPNMKPLSMDVSGLQGKILVYNAPYSTEHIKNKLESLKHISNDWIAQEKLKNSKKGEALWWGVRLKNGDIYGLSAYEHMKYPKYGGSACLVSSSHIPKLDTKAKKILEAIDFHGVAELPFLLDKNNNWRLIEINIRAWLQIALPTRANLNLIKILYLDSINKTPKPTEYKIRKKYWVNLERLVLAFLSGDYGNRFFGLFKAIKITKKSHCKIIYDTPLKGIRRRWFLKIIKKVLHI